MRVPGVIYASEALVREMDEKVREQIINVAMLPGIQRASYAMPDAHWGYGFPIGGVAAFDPRHGGIVSAGGVGFDISCGVRTLHTGLTASAIEPLKRDLAHQLSRSVPAGVGSRGRIHLDDRERVAGSRTKWAPWARAITTSRCSASRRSTTLMSRGRSVSRWTMWWSPFTAAPED
jgi:tRNA-splicing ligase RtcB